MRIWVAVAAAVVSGGLTGCSASQATAADPGPAVPASATFPARVGVDEFAGALDIPGVQIIDVRTPEEFATGHITGAVNIPVQQADFARQVSALDPDGVYAVYCRSGNRSRPAVTAMQQAGISTIYELESGIVGWTAAGQSVSR